MSRNEIERALRDYLTRRGVPGGELAGETPLFTSGLLDSLAFLDLVVFIEQTFRVRLYDHADVSFETLDTIARIADLVEKIQA